MTKYIPFKIKTLKINIASLSKSKLVENCIFTSFALNGITTEYEGSQPVNIFTVQITNYTQKIHLHSFLVYKNRAFKGVAVPLSSNFDHCRV